MIITVINKHFDHNDLHCSQCPITNHHYSKWCLTGLTCPNYQLLIAIDCFQSTIFLMTNQWSLHLPTNTLWSPLFPVSNHRSLCPMITVSNQLSQLLPITSQWSALFHLHNCILLFYFILNCLWHHLSTFWACISYFPLKIVCSTRPHPQDTS